MVIKVIPTVSDAVASSNAVGQITVSLAQAFRPSMMVARVERYLCNVTDWV